MASVSAVELKVGNLIRYEDSIYRVVKLEHVKPGKGGAFMQTELKDIKNATKLNKRFRSDQVLDKIVFESKKVQYLYKSGNDLEVMDLESYEQSTISSSLLSAPVEFLEDLTKATNLTGDGVVELTIDVADEDIVSVNLPQSVVCKIKETAPFFKGQTAKSSYKPALLENGLTIQVPEFIESGEEIVVSTLNQEYVERAKK